MLRLALAKAGAVARGLAATEEDQAHAVVVGADTIVVSPDGDVFGKPTGRADFLAMLRALSGRRHQVLTGVAVIAGARRATALAAAAVTLGDVRESDTAAYWATGEPCDKAGGYGLQGVGAIFVRSIDGSPSAVIGLPLDELERLLRECGVDTWRSRGAQLGQLESRGG